jgi:hypothetical protein
MIRGRTFLLYAYEKIAPTSDKTTNAKNTYIVIPPNSSNDPKPRADNAMPNKGKQQGEVIAVNIMPKIPIFSMYEVFFML